jgi:hypothetical protein
LFPPVFHISSLSSLGVVIKLIMSLPSIRSTLDPR